jgi:hypothetical protein
MSIRRNEIHLSTKVTRALWLLAKRKGKIIDPQGLDRIITADELADQTLDRFLAEKHPDVYEILADNDKREADFIKKGEPK